MTNRPENEEKRGNKIARSPQAALACVPAVASPSLSGTRTACVRVISNSTHFCPGLA